MANGLRNRARNDTAPSALPAARTAVGGILGNRIAQKIFLGYVLPLAVLIAFGLILPIFLWFYLGQAQTQYDASDQLADRVSSLRRAAIDADDHARSYIQYGDENFREQYRAARILYNSRFQEISHFVEVNVGSLQGEPVASVSRAYQDWQRGILGDVVGRRNRPALSPKGKAESARLVAEQFAPLKASLDRLVASVDDYREKERVRARAADLMRRVTSVAIPLLAILLSLLIGRSIALGITRPIEALTRATEALESGKIARLLIEDANGEGFTDIPDDEIGDLQQAFRRMARTIGQREALLSAQNEALGALNRRIEAVLNATNDGILMLDRAEGFSLVNQRFAFLFGLEIDELLDHTFTQAGSLLLSRFSNKAEVRARFEEIINDPEAVADETFEVIAPVARTVRVYSAPVRGESLDVQDRGGRQPHRFDEGHELIGRIFVFRDVTRETVVDRMKTEFVSTVSHELRTPLTAIKGYVDLMVGGQTGPLNEIQTEFLTMVQTSTRRLTTLINDMLDISRIESGRIEIKQESVEYLAVVRQTVRLMQQEAQAKSITLTVDVVGGEENRVFPTVSGDSDRITQVLTNFISNGIKYTPPEGQVTIRVEFENNFVTTCVADTGIGIASSDQRKLFQKFFRADNSTTREVGGTGLGLAITKAILEKLHGSVWVDSEPGSGSRFWFTLPCAETLPAGTESATEAASGETRAMHRLVLSIAGDVSVLHRMGHELRRQGFVTSNAATLPDALRRARDLRPDIITLDPLAPTLDGFATLRALQKNEATADTPVALLSLATVGGTTEFTDAVAYIGRSAAPERYREALAPLIARARGRSSRVGPTTFLVVGSNDLCAMMHHLNAAGLNCDGHDIQIVGCRDLDEASRSMAGDLLADIIVLDIGVGSGTVAAVWLAKVMKRREGEPMPLMIVLDDDVLSGPVYPIARPGQGPVRIEEIGRALHDLMAQDADHGTAAITGAVSP